MILHDTSLDDVKDSFILKRNKKSLSTVRIKMISIRIVLNISEDCVVIALVVVIASMTQKS